VVVIVQLQLPMQPVSITTNVVSSNVAYGVVYSIQYYAMNFVIVIADQALDCHIGSGSHDESNKINCCRVMIVVLNATFNNIPAMSWRSVLLVEENQSSW
jgi:hypothetical protein